MKRLIATLGAVLFGAVAAASPNQADAQAGVIYACVNNGSGTIRIVSAVDTCGNNEIPLTWNAVGPEGPPGPQGPPGPAGDSAATMRYAGHTSDIVKVTLGPGGLSLACAAEYGSGHRICTSEEFVKTVDPNPPIPESGGWIMPTFVPTGTGEVMDISGLGASSGSALTCEGWANLSAPGGLTVTSNGQFRVSSCNINRTVACCGPPL